MTVEDDVGPWVRGRAIVRRASTGLYAATDRASGRAVSIRAPLVGIADEHAARAELSREAKVLSRFGPHEAILALGADESALSPPRLGAWWSGTRRWHTAAAPTAPAVHASCST